MSWLPKKSVVVPVDFSEHSLTAIQTALEFVSSPNEVHVVHVIIPLDMISVGEMWVAEDVVSRKNAAVEYLDKYLKEHGVMGVTSVVREGDPGLQIAEYAKTVGADLIVIPSHGRHGFERMLLGSVSERVLRHADCQILMLRRAE
ncbi:MAG: UspA protein [Planctomycetaceae bacterium]|nr:UspA protein [Planctomycetaceae bacterium]